VLAEDEEVDLGLEDLDLNILSKIEEPVLGPRV
jgi:hypothetical protein